MPLPGVAEDPLSRILTGGSPDHLVFFAPGDKDNPFEWALRQKVLVICLIGAQMFWLTGISAIIAPASDAIQEEFNISAVQSRLPVSCYLFGFALGPVGLTPLAEDSGRLKVYCVSIVLSYLFTLGCALANNITTLSVCRFLAGVFASPIFNSVCNIPDLFDGSDVVGLWFLNLWALLAESIVIAPIFGGYILARAGWRWIFWTALIVGVALFIPFALFCPETRCGPLLVARAKKERQQGNPEAWAIHERIGRRKPSVVFKETVLRPIVMLTTEPIVFLFGLWDGLNYGLIYCVVESESLVYEQYGFTSPNINLVFIAVEVGYLIAIPLFVFQLRAVARAERIGGDVGLPENKLYWGFFAGILFPISIYWFGWTSQPGVHYIASLVGLCAFGTSSHVLFLVVSDYTVESYGLMASSAVTGQSLFREALSGILALVVIPFYQNIGIQWASCILAIIATVMAPLPFIFFRYGSRIRAASRYSQELARLEREEQARAKWLAERKVEIQLEPTQGLHSRTTAALPH